jgi:Trk K+ transport system NAD-binding subunit
VVVFGVGRYGARLMHRLTDLGVPVLGVDFDPEAVRVAARAGLHVRFGDAEDAEFGHSLPLAGARIAVATMADPEAVRHLRQALRQAGYDGELVAAARMPGASEALQRVPVDLVLDPFDDAADQAAAILSARLKGEAWNEPQAD